MTNSFIMQLARSLVYCFLVCLITLLVGACGETKEVATPELSIEEPETVSDWEALFADTPDPKTLPDELKADQSFPKQFDLC